MDKLVLRMVNGEYLELSVATVTLLGLRRRDGEIVVHDRKNADTPALGRVLKKIKEAHFLGEILGIGIEIKHPDSQVVRHLTINGAHISMTEEEHLESKTN